jgi:hypothetical protein
MRNWIPALKLLAPSGPAFVRLGTSSRAYQGASFDTPPSRRLLRTIGLGCLLLSALAVALGGCAESDLAATAPVQVSGQMLQASGQAEASTQVTLEREPPSPFAGQLLGAACDPDAAYQSFLTGRTNTAGSYAFSLVGSDTQSSGDDALCFRIQNSQGALGVAVAFDVQVDQLQLPALQIFDPRLAETTAAGALSFSWSEPNPASDQETLSLAAADGSILWQAASSGQGAAILPGYLAEDATQSAAWESLVTTPTDGTQVVLARSASLAIAPPAVVPPSRGAACSSSLGTSGGAGALPTPCPLTDGKFHDGLADLAAPPTWVAVDLAAPVAASRVVLRGLSSFGAQLVVEGSLDGASWRQLATASTEAGAEYLDIALPGVTSLAHVRLTATGASDAQENVIQGLAQVSIF